MPDEKISALTELALGDVADNDVLAIVDTSAGSTKKVQADSLYAYVQKNKNKIINGCFRRWERGTSFNPSTTSNTFTADRWEFLQDGSIGTTSIDRVAFSLGQTDVPHNPKYYLQKTITTVGTSQTLSDIRNKIEDVRHFSGIVVTLSFYTKTVTGTENVKVVLAQNFGTGGTPSSAVNNAVTLTSVTHGSWKKYTGTITLPSISGKTIGTNDDSFLDVIIRKDSLADGDVVLYAQVQLEEGPIATQFEQRPIAEELALCKRYYYKITTGDPVGVAAATSTTHIRVERVHSTEMRTSPTITATGNFRIDGLISDYVSFFASYQNVSKSCTLVFDTPVGFTLTKNNSHYVDASTNDGSSTNEIYFDAEL